MRVVLGNGNGLRYPIGRAGGGEYERQRPVVDERLQQRRGAANIVAIIKQRLAHRLPDIGKGGKVHHCRGAVPLQHCVDARDVGNIALLQRPPFHRPAIAAREVVVDDRLKALRGKRLANMATDVAGAAGDEDIQGLISRSARPTQRHKYTVYRREIPVQSPRQPCFIHNGANASARARSHAFHRPPPKARSKPVLRPSDAHPPKRPKPNVKKRVTN